MTSAKFWGILDPSSTLSAFHATYQYCLSAKLANSCTPSPSMRTPYVCTWSLWSTSRKFECDCREKQINSQIIGDKSHQKNS